MSTAPDATTVAPTVSLLRQYLPMILVILTTLGGAVGVAPAMGQQRANEVAEDVALVVERTSKTVDNHAERINALAISTTANDVATAAMLDGIRKDIRDIAIQVEALRAVVGKGNAAALQRAVDRADAAEPAAALAPDPLLPILDPAPRLPASLNAMKDGGP